MCSSILKQILWSQETATFSVTDMDMSVLCANGWCQMTTKWPYFVKMARTASVRDIINLQMCLRRFPLHWDQHIYIWLPNLWSKHRAVLRIPIKFITLDTIQMNGMTLHRLIKITQACAQISVYEAKYFFQ